MGLRRTWAFPALLFLAAFALRLWLVRSPIYGDEAAHYHIARFLGAPPTNVYHADFLPTHLFAARPAFFLALAPGAQFGFTGFRVENALISALIPVLAWFLLRQVGAGRMAAGAAAATLALHPWAAIWGVRVFPDSLMILFVLAGLLAHVKGRPLVAGAWFVAAVWSKETGAVALAAVAAHSLWKAVRGGEAGLWPLRLDRPSTAYLGAGLLAAAPLLFSTVVLGARPPGWATTPISWTDADTAFLSAWLLLPLLAGLRWPRTRPWSALGLMFPLFYLAYSVGLGRGISVWYYIGSAALATIGAFLVLDEAARRSTQRPVWKWGPVAMSALILLPLAFSPGGVAAGVAAPLSSGVATDFRSLAELADAFDPVVDAADFVRGAPNALVVDAGWFYVLHPFSTAVRQLGYAYSEFPGPLAGWIRAIEVDANWTVVERHDIPLNHAILEVYADCIRHDNGDYAVLEGQSCAGRRVQLESAWVARGGTP